MPAVTIDRSQLTAAAVKVSLGDRHLWALVDTGADFSMIKDGLQGEIQKNLGCRLFPPVQPARGAGGEPLHIAGVLQEVPLKVQDKLFTCPSLAVVGGLVYDLVLGRDFCCRYGTVIDDQSGTLRLAGMKIPLPKYSDIRPSRARILLCATAVVPPRTACVVSAKVVPIDGALAEHPQVPFQGIIEPSGTSAREQVLIPRELVDVDADGLVPVRLTNTGPEEARLLQGADIGTFFALNEGREDNMYELCPVDGGSGRIQTAAVCTEHPRDEDVVAGENQRLEVDQSDLSPTGKEKLRSLISAYQDIFSHHPGDIGKTHLVEHRIDTGDTTPIRQRPRRVPIKLREQVEKQKQQMLKDGIIEESDSPWCSPVVLARKKDGSFRFCVDMRAVNKVTRGLAHPLPRVDDALDSLAGARWYTTLDMATGYWQVGLAEEDREKTAFTTGKGLHQFKVMAMGLKNASGTFQKLMELVLSGLDTKNCLVYLDDIILFNRTEDEHIATLRDVFHRIRTAGLKLKPQKCRLARREVTFLGHMVSEDGIRPDPRNGEKVLRWPEPSTEDEMKSFLGLAGYYSRFIKDYAEISKPLREAEADIPGGALKWTEGMRDAFKRLKVILASPPILRLPTFKGTFVLYTDACNNSVGAVLAERIGEEERVIAYESKVLSKQQKRWPTYDKELWAIVHSIRRFSQYTIGSRFEVVTDHKPLANIPQSIAVERDGTGRRGRWAVELSSFEFKVTIRKGLDHINADALSRRPEPGTRASGTNATGRVAVPKQEREARTGEVIQMGGMPDSHQSEHGPSGGVDSVLIALSHNEESKLREAQGHDPVINQLREQCGNRTLTKEVELGEWRMLRTLWSKVEVRHGVMGISFGHRFRALVPAVVRDEIMAFAHGHTTSGHLGRTRTTLRLKCHFIWPGMYKDVRNYCDACVLCQRRHCPIPKKQAPLVTEVMSRPFERIALDITEMPNSAKGNKYALVAMDYFSKYVRVYPMPDQKTETVLEALLDWVHDFGVPERLHTDQGRQFEADLFQLMCEKLGIQKTRTTPYHPESDGMVERFMRTLKDIVAKYVDEEGLQWDINLKAYSMAYNSSVHSTTGFSPYFLVHGFEPRLPLEAAFAPPRKLVPAKTFITDRMGAMRDAHRRVRIRSERVSKETARRYDHRVNEVQYREGDQVWVRDHRAAVGGKPKLGLPYSGPANVIGKVGKAGKEVAYRIRDQRGRVRVVHHNHLKPVVGSSRVFNAASRTPDMGLSKQHLSAKERPDVRCDGSGKGTTLSEDELSRLLIFSAMADPQGQRVSTEPTMKPYVTRSGRISKPVGRFQPQ